MAHTELRTIVKKFAESGWDVLDIPAKRWLADDGAPDVTAALCLAVEEADRTCGSCGCEFDPLYKRALTLLRAES